MYFNNIPWGKFERQILFNKTEEYFIPRRVDRTAYHDMLNIVSKLGNETYMLHTISLK